MLSNVREFSTFQPRVNTQNAYICARYSVNIQLAYIYMH